MRGANVEISVVMAVYNGEKYLKEAIDSIRSQTFGNFEFIIINDGSTDTTSEIIFSYSDPRIVYLENETNKGLVYSLNRGLSSSKGKYIARMDADDIALPQRLQIQFNYMEAHPEIGICGSNVEAFFNTKKKSVIIRFPKTDKLIKVFPFFQSPFSHPSVIMRKETLVKNNLSYTDKFLHAEDYALWVELLRYTKAYNIPRVLLRYRIHEASVTAGTRTDKSFINSVLIQNKYIQDKNITISFDDTVLFSRFTNRHENYSLNADDQQTIDRILENFFSQLFEKQKKDYPVAMDFVSSACFYRFLKGRKYPQMPFLKKLYWKGLRVFIKKLPIYLNRFLTQS
ncbi:MAG: glycosyltransferase [Dysgonamonadaceae bacterium]|jgi:glycosyltransferase involved in cell wall biosynthesis|nr:glycosyltransferase [Dysgonamonadaceae bacterium]